ncbi:MAG: hypothetical protein HQK58_17245 [Deltaproteobacteria bacterium]|nr:hypothetical protein [Deltaproteobacteria bacterium]MBF0527537.1 hypothetical protein [Deltaproteobacteria bacterium]
MLLNSILSGSFATIQAYQPLQAVSPVVRQVKNDGDSDNRGVSQAASTPGANMKGQTVGSLIDIMA